MPRASVLASQIRSRIDAFAIHLASLIHGEALRVVRQALGGPDTAPARRGPGRPRGSAKGRNPSRRSGSRHRSRSTGTTRVDLVPRVLAHVEANPGQGVTEIAAALGTSSEAVKPVVAALLDAKEIRKTGERRGTKYHPKGSGAGARPSKTRQKAARKKASSTASPNTTKTKPSRKRVARKAAGNADRETQQPSRSVAEPSVSKPLPVKTIPAQRAPKPRPQSVEGQEPSAFTAVEAVIPAPESATGKDSLPKTKKRSSKKAVATKSTAQELAEALASKA